MGIRLNIIYDDRNQEKYDPLIEEINRQRVEDYRIWEAVVLRDSVVASINASHKMIVREAKERGLKEVCIAEDDLMFPAADGWAYFLKNKPETYDLYLGATYVVPISNNIICGFHLYMVHEKFYDSFLSVPDTAHIDTAMADLKGDYKYCYPFAALQRPGLSANNKGQIVNYNKLLSPEDIYQ